MAPKRSLLEKMRDNPASDWTIADVKKLCAQEGLDCRTPNGGSHYVVTSDVLEGHQTVPAKRPIKVVYIRSLVGMADAHRKAKGRKK